MSSEALSANLQLALRNNAEWCDLVCRSHGQLGQFHDSAWVDYGPVPEFYPNIISLTDSTRQLTDDQIPTLRAKWASLSEYVMEIKQIFSCWYNKRHRRRGFFWGERFKRVLVDNGDTLVNCLAYISAPP